MFRDLCVYAKNHPGKYKAKDFFLSSILQNKQFLDDFDENKTISDFQSVDEYYKQTDQEGLSVRSEVADFLTEEPPEKKEISDNMIDLVKNAKSKVQIIQPYIQNIREFEDALEDAMKRNVEVEIITARKRDQPIYASLLNSDLFRRLLKSGAKVYEEPYKFLHMKALSVDNKFLSIGSMNQDNTSFY